LRFQTALLILLAAALAACGQEHQRSRLVVYSPHGPEITAEIEKQFETAEPSIDVSAQYLSQTAILQKLRAERDNPYCDVWWGGTTQFFDQAVAEGLLQPYAPSWAGAIPKSCRQPEGYWHGQFLQISCLIFNDKVMTAEEAPKDWDELLEEEWKGRIVIREPLESGTMRTIYSAMILRAIQLGGTEEDGFDWLRKLDAQTASYVPNPEAMYDKVGRSPQGYITLWNLTDALFQKHRNNFPFGFVVMKSPGPVSVDALAITASSPNLEAAKKFVEFCANAESSKWLAEEHYRFNARQDLPPEAIPDWRKGIEYVEMKIDWADFNAKVMPWMEHWRTEIRDPKK
jgi:iron(III) transport system substrate-binding protein